MASKKIKTKDILGENYYKYNLSSSNYSPSLNSSITITCVVKNVYGDVISNKSLQLKQNGVNVGSSVSTNSNGVATWTVTCSNSGLQEFSIEGNLLEVFVDNKVDDSDLVGTFTELQELITNASSGDTIVLEKNYKNTDNTNIVISNKSLTIIGNGHIIDGNEQNKYIMIIGDSSVSYNIENVIFTNFTQGSVIQGVPQNSPTSNGYTLNIQYCTFINNNTGILYNASGGSDKNISNCVFINHSTSAINIPTQLTTINCTFINSPINSTYVSNKNYLTDHQSLTNYIQKSNTTGLIKNDGTIDTNTYSQTNHTHNTLTGIEIPLGADLNDYTTEGYYYHSPGQYSNVLHTPVTMLTGFKLIVSTRTHPNGTIIKNQIFINEVTNTIYIRDSHTKPEYWSDWYHFYTPNTNPIVSSFSNQLSDNNIPSEKLVKNSLNTKQDTLVSGTNIKSINGSSLIGSGNLTINPTLNGYCEDGTSGYNIFEDTNGSQMFFMDYKLVFDFDTGKIYYDPLNLYNYSSNTEIATIGDINGKADINDFDTLTATVTYTDNTSETVTFYVVPTQNNSS